MAPEKVLQRRIELEQLRVEDIGAGPTLHGKLGPSVLDNPPGGLIHGLIYHEHQLRPTPCTAPKRARLPARPDSGVLEGGIKGRPSGDDFGALAQFSQKTARLAADPKGDSSRQLAVQP